MTDKAMDELSAEYLELRLKREHLKHEWEAQDTKIADEMDKIETAMLDVLNETNASSISTDNAVIMRRVTQRYNPTNWDAVYKLIERHSAYGLLHKRIHDGNMKDFLDQHPDEYPAGLNVDSRYAVTVRRKSST